MAVEIAPRLFRIGTMGAYVNSFAFVNDDGSVTLVDCGYEKAPAKLVGELALLGKHPKDVVTILLTHAHDDHVGGAAEMIRRSAAQQVLMHELDAELAASGKTPDRDGSTVSGRLMSRLPQRRYSPFQVTRTLREGDVVDAAGGLQVIHTPGHTNGHISLLHSASETLITGDSIFNMTSRLTWGLSGFCVSYQQSKQSARRFLELDFKTAAFTHGPEIRDRGKDRIKQFLSKRGIS